MSRNVSNYDGGVAKYNGNSSRNSYLASSARKKTLDGTSGGSFLVGELEKLDNKLKEPLKSITWPRDVPVRVGGGWIEHISALFVEYGSAGGGTDANVIAPSANAIPIIQANVTKDTYKTTIFSAILRVPFIDVERGSIVGRDLETLCQKGIRNSYDLFMDNNTYLGSSRNSTTGLLNNPTVDSSLVPKGAKGSTTWAMKTPDEILADINGAIEQVWNAAGNDLAAMPNQICLPYKQFMYLATTRLGDIHSMSLYKYLMENNVAKFNGVDLVITANKFSAGAGAGGLDRMAVYINDDDFMAMEELVSLTRAMTNTVTETVSYDTVYLANVSELQIFYPTIAYKDGI